MIYYPEGIYHHHRIQIFDVSGNEPKFIRTWGKMGSEVGELSYPYEIILDGEGHVYVCEFGNHRIQKFDLNGKSLGTWGSAGKEPGQLHQPWAMCWDSERELHIVDTYNNRIQRFPSSQLGNSTLPVTAEK